MKGFSTCLLPSGGGCPLKRLRRPVYLVADGSLHLCESMPLRLYSPGRSGIQHSSYLLAMYLCMAETGGAAKVKERGMATLGWWVTYTQRARRLHMANLLSLITMSIAWSLIKRGSLIHTCCKDLQVVSISR